MHNFIQQSTWSEEMCSRLSKATTRTKKEVHDDPVEMASAFEVAGILSIAT